MRKLTLSFCGALLLLTLFPAYSSAQIIWQETFTYPDGTFVGANNNTANPDPDWTSDCTTCVGGDWFEVRSGKMEGLDTNGPAELLSEVIDISAYPLGVDFLASLEQSGTMEGCFTTAGGVCDFNCVDWVQVSLSIDGGAFVDLVTGAGGSCTGGYVYAPDAYTALGNFAPFTVAEKGITGNTLQFRIRVQNWAASEIHRIDNIFVTEPNVLPVQFLAVYARKSSESHAMLVWDVAEETNVLAYQIERKSASSPVYELLGEIPAQGLSRYSFEAPFFLRETTIYRLRSVDADGQTQLSPSVELHPEEALPSVTAFPNPTTGTVTFHSTTSPITNLRVYDLTGRQVMAHAGTGQHDLAIDLGNLPSGLYLYRASVEDGVFKGVLNRK